MQKPSLLHDQAVLECSVWAVFDDDSSLEECRQALRLGVQHNGMLELVSLEDSDTLVCNLQLGDGRQVEILQGDVAMEDLHGAGHHIPQVHDGDTEEKVLLDDGLPLLGCIQLKGHDVVCIVPCSCLDMLVCKNHN